MIDTSPPRYLRFHSLLDDIQYFGLCIFAAIPAVIVAVRHMTDKYETFGQLHIVLVAFSLVVFPVSFWTRLRGLKFKVVGTEAKSHESFEVIRLMAEQAGWQPIQLDSPSFLAFQVPRSHWSWGEMVVVYCQNDAVSVVSICSPQLQAIAIGTNRVNIQRVHDAVLKTREKHVS